MERYVEINIKNGQRLYEEREKECMRPVVLTIILKGSTEKVSEQFLKVAIVRIFEEIESPSIPEIGCKFVWYTFT